MIYSIPILLLSFFAADQTPSPSPADQLAGLAKEGTAIHDNFFAELTKAGHDMARVTAANENYRADSSAWAERAGELLKAHPAEPASLDVILAMNEVHYVDDDAVVLPQDRHGVIIHLIDAVHRQDHVECCRFGGMREGSGTTSAVTLSVSVRPLA